MSYKKRAPKRSRLSAALFAALLIPASSLAMAQDTAATDADDEDTTTLDQIVVTGSLIPQSQLETATPVTVITAEDISARGFTSVSDVLQESSFSVGGIQGSQTSASFTQGAETISLFGLPVGFTKFLIDGRPLANYPALYNGGEAFNNISGIPIDLVDRIEILPGGQSSLYGSDAIAGVINIILKKSIDGSVVNIRGGAYKRGGGDSIRASFATGFSSADERFNLLFGVQAENRDAIWGYQRDITSQYYNDGTSAPLASRDWLVYSPFTSYNWLVADDACDAVNSGFNGGVDQQVRPGFGDELYCGSFNSPGFRTLQNSKEAYQLYSHMTFDVSDNASLYGDVLFSKENIAYHVGSNYTWWGTSVEWGYFYDPNLDDFMNLQRAFVPEDMGGFENSMNIDKSQAYALTFGIEGTFGNSSWDYDVGVSATRYELDEVGFVRWADPMNDFFQDLVLGPQLGWDPYYGAYPVFNPDYAAFYQLLTPDQFNAMTGYATSRSETTDNFARAQVVNGSLWDMRGGSAGLAVAVEAGKQGWTYDPHPGYLNGDVWGTTAVAGDGDRTRYAVTGELRTPWHDMFTTTVSARYDAYRFDGRTMDAPTYSVGMEFRPMESLLIRGKYGTAFKAPSLPDLYQGESGYYGFVTDYYNCALLGYSYVDAPGSCPAVHSSRQFFGVQSGSTELDPIEADVWTFGAVFAPFDRFSVSVDYHSWDIRDQVNTQSAAEIVLTEARCRLGELDINSPTCVAAMSQVIRGSTGRINEIFTPKVNVSKETVEALVAAVNYGWEWEGVGEFAFRGNFTHMMDHTYTPYEGDEAIDLLKRPGWSSDPRNKADASLTFRRNRWSTTLYANWMDNTPNYRARVYDDQTDPTGLAGELPSYTRWNASVSWAALDNLELSFMVNNVLDDMPPEDHTYPGTTGAPYNSAQYDVFGRSYYLEGRYSF
ncbi:TonB-dependent receptor [bacterium BD-1]|nr:TonB-dependent receptor [Ottowia caeni]